MMESVAEHFDAVVIGSGEGGKYLAWHLARSGEKVAVVERRWVGGSCPNVNCLPSKNEIYSAHVARLVKHAADFGITTGPVTLDMERVRARKREMVDGLIAVQTKLYVESGAELIMGEGRLVGQRQVLVSLNAGGTRRLVADKLFLNLGTRATIPNISGLVAANPLTHIEALELAYVPRHLIVLGGGYVGLEMAQALRRFGAQVTIVEQGAQLAAREDTDVADALHAMLLDEGMKIYLNARVQAVHGRSGEAVKVSLDTPTGVTELHGSDILVAAGRAPNTVGIGLNENGINLDGRGFIAVNDRLETSAAQVWAIGEVAGSQQFTHVSLDDFRVIRDNLAGGNRTTRGRVIPYAMFTEPPLGRVGLSEKQAADQGLNVRVATLPMQAVLRARTLSETRGFMKAIVAADSDAILGFTAFGPDAGEVMTVVQMAMLADLPYTALQDAIIAHPTMAEGLNGLFSRVSSRGK